MIFLTVGTQFPFDRLVKAVDDCIGCGVITEPVFAQTGRGNYKPAHMDFAETLARDQYAERFRQASAVIAHAGIGTIVMALDAHKPLLVMPRLKRFGEIVNDHQVATAQRFAELGHVLSAADESQVEPMLVRLFTFAPVRRVPDVEALVSRVGSFLNDLQVSRNNLTAGHTRR